MELGSISTALRRFWPAAILVFAVVLGLGINATRNAPTWHMATGQYVLIQPAVPITEPEQAMIRDANPYGVRERGAAALGASTAARLTSARVQQAAPAGAQGFSPSEPSNDSRFAVVKDDKETLYTVSAWSTDEEAARATVAFALTTAPLITTDLQTSARAPAESRFVAATVVQAQLAPTPTSSGLRLLVAYGGLALLAGLAMAVLMEFFVRLGRRRQTTGATAKEG